MKPLEVWSRCAKWAGLNLPGTAVTRLMQYRDWLGDEGIRGGGLGRGEGDRIDRRHIGDSLLFSRFIESATDEVWDLGSGVGLPGIPLAVVMPGTRFVLVDRSARRTELARRIIRILQLENVQVIQDDFKSLEVRAKTIVSRATLPPPKAGRLFSELLAGGGRAVVGGSWEAEPHYRGWETHHVPAWVLDQDVWLLMMRQP